MAYIRKQITNHPVLTDVERYVSILELNISDIRKRLHIDYKIEYIKNGEDVTSSFNQNLPRWEVTNGYKIQVLDINDQPILNPDYEPVYNIIGYDEEDQPIYGEDIINSEEEYVLAYAYDYFKSITFDSPTPISIPLLLDKYITRDDLHKNRFNF